MLGLIPSLALAPLALLAQNYFPALVLLGFMSLLAIPGSLRVLCRVLPTGYEYFRVTYAAICGDEAALAVVLALVLAIALHVAMALVMPLVLALTMISSLLTLCVWLQP